MPRSTSQLRADFKLNRPRVPTSTQDSPPAQIAAALPMLRQAASFAQAAHVVSLVPAGARLDLVAWLAPRPALYPRTALEAAVDAVPEADLVTRFGDAQAHQLLGFGCTNLSEM